MGLIEVTTQSLLLKNGCWVIVKDGKAKLTEHSKEFRKEVINVTENVYVGVGYGGSNSTMIVGDDGVIIIDTLESIEGAENLKKEFDSITDKPVKAIIYSHFHGDHTGGASVFAADYAPEIIANDLLTSFKVKSPVGKILGKRGVHQFGFDLPDDVRLNFGIGPAKRPMRGFGQGWMKPTKTFTDERYKLTVSGVKLELVKSPGETDDHIYTWIPEKKLLLCADNYYKSFPNIAPIRGSPYRNIVKWTESLDKIIAEGAEYLVPGHTRPIIGADEIRRVLTIYRDAIRFVYDKTIEGMNEGLTPNELVGYVKLPKHMVEEPCLQEFYGTVDWAVRSIFTGLAGWFDGNPTNLFPLPPSDYAEKLVSMVGGVDVFIQKIHEAYDHGEFQWVLHMVDILQALEQSPEIDELKWKALNELGELQLNATSRNYFLTASQKTREK
jgi:alkyl sulfatase BDS1-like metallo-beta-lactamase superfamily hydrolase